MSDEMVPTEERNLISLEIKNELEKLGFALSETPDAGLIWGFDGTMKYFPRETYVREAADGKPLVKLRVEKTINGLTLVVNSVPFNPQRHIDRAELDEKAVVKLVNDYVKVL
ncbi:hypothetical protein A3K63_04685 [Candidatus Micrarchaeota archaeon RBG_16_49_10]|nr:MAG: hypothetical protein A3K63_04685 [Candidatus Micrarchaeota archaeon RBG_16_49_10]